MKAQCPHCQQHYEVDDEFLGATVTCEICKRDFVIEELVEKKIKKPIMTTLKTCIECGEMIPSGEENCPYCSKKMIISSVLWVILVFITVALSVWGIITLNAPSKEEREKLQEQTICQKIRDTYSPSSYLNQEFDVSDFNVSFSDCYKLYVTINNKKLPKDFKNSLDDFAELVSDFLRFQKVDNTSVKVYLLSTVSSKNAADSLVLSIANSNQNKYEGRNVIYISSARNGQHINSELTDTGEQMYQDSMPAEELERYHAENRLKHFKEKFINPDGSVKPVVEYAKDRMKNPDSFQHAYTKYTPVSKTNEEFQVRMTFRGTNGFGGVVPQTVSVKVTYWGHVDSWSWKVED